MNPADAKHLASFLTAKEIGDHLTLDHPGCPRSWIRTDPQRWAAMWMLHHTRHQQGDQHGS